MRNPEVRAAHGSILVQSFLNDKPFEAEPGRANDEYNLEIIADVLMARWSHARLTCMEMCLLLLPLGCSR